MVSEWDTTYLKEGVYWNLASSVKPNKVVDSWLVAMTMAAERVAAAARSLSRTTQALEALAIGILPANVC